MSDHGCEENGNVVAMEVDVTVLPSKEAEDSQRFSVSAAVAAAVESARMATDHMETKVADKKTDDGGSEVQNRDKREPQSNPAPELEPEPEPELEPEPKPEPESVSAGAVVEVEVEVGGSEVARDEVAAMNPSKATPGASIDALAVENGDVRTEVAAGEDEIGGFSFFSASESFVPPEDEDTVEDDNGSDKSTEEIVLDLGGGIGTTGPEGLHAPGRLGFGDPKSVRDPPLACHPPPHPPSFWPLQHGTSKAVVADSVIEYLTFLHVTMSL
jgi:hypothetical protein